MEYRNLSSHFIFIKNILTKAWLFDTFLVFLTASLSNNWLNSCEKPFSFQKLTKVADLLVLLWIVESMQKIGNSIQKSFFSHTCTQGIISIDFNKVIFCFSEMQICVNILKCY